MNPSDPTTWFTPDWHPDWGDVATKFAMLRSFAASLLRACPNCSVELNIPETGYAYVKIAADDKPLGELYVTRTAQSRSHFEYALYLLSSDDEQEFFGKSVDELVAQIASVIAKKGGQERKTVAEWLAEKRLSDPVLRAREVEAQRRQVDAASEFRELEKPVLNDLRHLGMDVETIGSATALSKYMPFKSDVACVFLKHLPNSHPRIRDVLIRLLAGAGPFDASVLVDLFETNSDSQLRWLIANTIASVRPTGIEDWLLRTLKNPLVGASKEMLIEAARRMLPPDLVNPVLLRLFDEYPTHVARSLAETGGLTEMRFLEHQLEETSGFAAGAIRKEITKAIDCIRRRGRKGDRSNTGGNKGENKRKGDKSI